MNEIVHITFGRTVIALRREISLPNDPVLCRQLEAKLEEYRNRLVKLEMTAHREASTNYKIWVLQQLLDQGKLDFLPLKAAVARDATNQTLAIAYLAYAWKVIENYCLNRGAQNRGGTGLPGSQLPSYQDQAASPFLPADSLQFEAPFQPAFEPALQSTAAVSSPAFEPVSERPSILQDERPAVAIPMEERSGKPKRSRVPLMINEDLRGPEPFVSPVPATSSYVPQRAPIVLDEDEATACAPFG